MPHQAYPSDYPPSYFSSSSHTGHPSPQKKPHRHLPTTPAHNDFSSVWNTPPAVGREEEEGEELRARVNGVELSREERQEGYDTSLLFLQPRGSGASQSTHSQSGHGNHPYSHDSHSPTPLPPHPLYTGKASLSAYREENYDLEKAGEDLTVEETRYGGGLAYEERFTRFSSTDLLDIDSGNTTRQSHSTSRASGIESIEGTSKAARRNVKESSRTRRTNGRKDSSLWDNKWFWTLIGSGIILVGVGVGVGTWYMLDKRGNREALQVQPVAQNSPSTGNLSNPTQYIPSTLEENVPPLESTLQQSSPQIPTPTEIDSTNPGYQLPTPVPTVLQL